jgi:hypothetical protein
LAARGGALKVGKRATIESSPGTDATAVRTTSSKYSNSTSLIVTSAWGPTVAKFFLFRIEQVAQIVLIRRSRLKNGYWILPFSPLAYLGQAFGGKV